MDKQLQLQQLKKRLDECYLYLKDEVGSSTMDIVGEIVDLELQIERIK